MRHYEGLFRLGTHVLHSGIVSDFKIDCDALSRQELRACAHIAAKLLPPFRMVKGIPTGGLAFAKELGWFADPDAETVVIADDVLTTGNSFEEFKTELIQEIPWPKMRMGKVLPRIEGIVIFARGKCPQWVTPVFTLNSRVPQEMTINDRNDDASDLGQRIRREVAA